MPQLTSWLPISENSDFSIHNLPFGIFSYKNSHPQIGVAIGNQILDLVGIAELGLFDDLGLDSSVLQKSYLNDFIALGKGVTTKVRETLQNALLSADSLLKDKSAILIPQAGAKMHLPVLIRDYTDFYSSIEHATNVGKMFRDPENALLPNWRHLPVGYHGRASSIIESGVAIHRPNGQNKPSDEPPVYGPSSRLDFELEMAFIVGKKTNLGQQVTTAEAEDYIFGMVLMNDWSARDIQKWEYVPLGPFLGKSFASSISQWVVTLEALEDFKVNGPKQEPPVLPYLQYLGRKNYNINLEVSISPKQGAETVVSRSNFKYMYWTMAQQLAHHTVNGCNLNIGDMMASGTISGKEVGSYGSMLELAWAGQKPLTLETGEERKFIHDYDEVTMRGFAQKDEKRVGFGKVRTKVLPAVE
ncbi:MAG: fumarylacetoacetase [Cyclobacteriaceae bacterium]